MNVTVITINGAVRITNATNVLNHAHYHVYMCIGLKIYSNFFKKPVTAKTLSGIYDSKSEKFEFAQTSKTSFLKELGVLNIARGNCLEIIDDCQDALSLALQR